MRKTFVKSIEAGLKLGLMINVLIAIKEIIIKDATVESAFIIFNTMNLLRLKLEDSFDRLAFAALSNYFLRSQSPQVRLSGFLIGGLNYYIATVDSKDLSEKSGHTQMHAPGH